MNWSSEFKKSKYWVVTLIHFSAARLGISMSTESVFNKRVTSLVSSLVNTVIGIYQKTESSDETESPDKIKI
jgi:hypothetical protein